MAHCTSLLTQQLRLLGFPIAGSTVYSSMPDELRDLAPVACDVDSFKQFFKTILFSFY